MNQKTPNQISRKQFLDIAWALPKIGICLAGLYATGEIPELLDFASSPINTKYGVRNTILDPKVRQVLRPIRNALLDYFSHPQMIVHLHSTSPEKYESQVEMAEILLKEGIPLSFGISPGLWPQDTFYEAGKNLEELLISFPGALDVAIEGYLHSETDYLGNSNSINTNLTLSLSKLCEFIPSKFVSTIVPPFASYNLELFTAMREHGLKVIFGDRYPVSHRIKHAFHGRTLQVAMDEAGSTVDSWDPLLLRPINQLYESILRFNKAQQHSPLIISVASEQIIDLTTSRIDQYANELTQAINALKQIGFFVITPSELYTHLTLGQLNISRDSHFAQQFFGTGSAFYESSHIDRLLRACEETLVNGAPNYRLAKASIIRGRLEDTPEIVLSALTFLKDEYRVSNSPIEKVALAEKIAFLESNANLGQQMFSVAAQHAKELEYNAKARLYSQIAQGHLPEFEFVETEILRNLAIPFGTKKIILGKSKFEVTQSTKIVSQSDRVTQDWYSEEWFRHPLYLSEDRSLIPWMEGSLLQTILELSGAQLIPVIGALAAKGDDGDYYGFNLDGQPAYKLWLDKAQIPTNLGFENLLLIEDTHGISVLAPTAFDLKADLVVGCGDGPGKMAAAYDLAKQGISVYFPPDRFVGEVIGYQGEGVLLGSAPISLSKNGAILGDRLIEIGIDEKIIVENTEVGYPLQYNDAPKRYFDNLREMSNFTFDLEFVNVDTEEGLINLVNYARTRNAKVVAARVSNEYDYSALREWLLESSSHRAVLFHSVPYEPGKNISREFPNQITFGDPKPDFSSDSLDLRISVPEFEDLAPISQEEYLNLARISWRFFNIYSSETGLSPGLAGYPYLSSWEMGSNVFAIVAANKIGLINQDEAESRLRRLLNYFSRMPLYRGVHGRTPNNKYWWESGEISDALPEGTQAVDLGRLLLSIKAVELNYPNLSSRARNIVGGWDIQNLVIDGVVYQVDYSGLKPEGVYPYSTYFSLGFKAWGLNVDKTLNQDLIPVKIDDGTFVPKSRQLQTVLTSDPLVYTMLESEYDVRSETRLLYQAQLRRYLKEGIFTAVGEGSIRGNPYFVFNTVMDNNLNPWATVRPLWNGTNGFERHRTVSSRIAVGFNALYDDGYSRALFRHVYDIISSRGYPFNGIFEDGRLNEEIESPNAGVILEAIAYKLSNGQRLTDVK